MREFANDKRICRGLDRGTRGDHLIQNVTTSGSNDRNQVRIFIVSARREIGRYAEVFFEVDTIAVRGNLAVMQRSLRIQQVLPRLFGLLDRCGFKRQKSLHAIIILLSQCRGSLKTVQVDRDVWYCARASCSAWLCMRASTCPFFT